MVGGQVFKWIGCISWRVKTKEGKKVWEGEW